MSLLRLPPTQMQRFADSVGFHLRRAHEAAQQHIADAIATTGLLPIHADVLGFIGDNPGTIPSVIAAALGRDRSSITATLRALLDRGLIERGRTRLDRRAAVLNVTDTGGAMLQRLQEQLAAHNARLDLLVGRDKLELLEQLNRITAALAEGNPER